MTESTGVEPVSLLRARPCLADKAPYCPAHSPSNPEKRRRAPRSLPFQILVSPFVHYDPINRTTDILMFNSRNLGALIVKEDPHVVAWDDNRYAIQGSSVPPLWDGTFEVEASEWPITRASARGPLSATFQNHCRASPPDPSELPTIQCIRKKPGLTRPQD